MSSIFFSLLFLASALLLVLSGKWVIEALIRVAKYLGWKEFVVAFFTISLGAVLPEFFVGISSAMYGIPELSFGNIVGQNILLLTFTTGICALLLKDGLEMESRTVKAGATFAIAAAFLPLLLAMNGVLSRVDGIILILFFFLFVVWLFSRKDRFTQPFDGTEDPSGIPSLGIFLRDIAIIIGGFLLIILSAEGITMSADAFSKAFALSITAVGLVIVAIGVGIPETYFAISLAQKGKSWMILGGLMGSIAVSSTLVLGTVALLHPIIIENFQPLIFGRIFLVLAALSFLFFVRSKHHVSHREAIFLLFLYALFLLTQIF